MTNDLVVVNSKVKGPIEVELIGDNLQWVANQVLKDSFVSVSQIINGCVARARELEEDVQKKQ